MSARKAVPLAQQVQTSNRASPERSAGAARPSRAASGTWPGVSPDPGFSPEEGPTDRDLLADREISIDPVTIYEPSREAPAENSLSREPEELGYTFLRDAVQQSDRDVEAPLGFQTDELELDAVDWDAKTEPDIAVPDDIFRERTDLDLSLDVIRDASLFDQPVDDDGEADTRSPRVRADDSAPPRAPERAARRR